MPGTTVQIKPHLYSGYIERKRNNRRNVNSALHNWEKMHILVGLDVK